MQALTTEIPGKPRFEFRSFGQDFHAAEKRMARLSVPIPEKYWERLSDEVYILSRHDRTHNVKIKNGLLDVKRLLQVTEGLEQWKPLLKATFPVNGEVMATGIFGVLGITIDGLRKDQYGYEDLIDMVNNHPDMVSVRVHKHRFGYVVNDTVCETAMVFINGARVTTISAESAVVEDIRKTITDIGLTGIENINYPEAIRRVIGWVDKPLVN